MTSDDLAFADCHELSSLLQRKVVSSVELTHLYLERLEKYGQHYGALVTLMPERALREAKRADRERAHGTVRSKLHGIPYGVKDLLATKDAPTTWGAAPYRLQHFDYDATVVKRLGDAGAVLLAKLAMVELAGGFGYNDADASFTGPGRTPWNRNFWSGGSSSGPGAATSAGLVGFAIGSETDGSIVVPAASCGVTGLRPTYGRVSRHGAMALSWSMDKLGPIARSARDAEIILRIISGADPGDPTSVTRPFARPSTPPRIAILAGSREKLMPAVLKNFNRSVRELATFASITDERTLPKAPWGDVAGNVINAECAAAFQDLIESGRARELQSVDDKLGGYPQLAVRAVDYINAQRQRSIMMNLLLGAFSDVDAVIWPTMSTVALPVGVPFDKTYPKYPGGTDLTTPGNVCGWPAIALPNGFGENNLPTSLSMMSAPFSETVLTSIAARYQQRTDYHRRRPPLGF
jgi:aspartyl-tRNA(Asn)/glutamyl-tRNA(Gln) amidotransferase subunit A